MAPVTNQLAKNVHVSRLQNGALEFHADSVEITVLDRRGHAIWKMSRGSAGTPIRWDGIDMHGHTINAGSYTCKIVYSDRQVVYVPFVFMK